MADLTIQHKTAKTLILRLREGLEQLERAEQVGMLFLTSSVSFIC